MVNLTPMYIAISIIALLIIVALVFFVKKNKKQKRLSTLTGLSFVFVIAGIVFGDDRLIGYGLIGVGIILAVVDIIMKLKKK
jgi:amino acid transporter